MNWKRGLFRAWLLLTGLWLALNVVFHRPDVEVQAYWKLREVEAVLLKKPPNEGEQQSAPAAANWWDKDELVTMAEDVVDQMLRGTPALEPLPKQYEIGEQWENDAGDVIEFDGTKWVPVRTATNKQTGEIVELVDGKWVPVLGERLERASVVGA